MVAVGARRWLIKLVGRHAVLVHRNMEHSHVCSEFCLGVLGPHELDRFAVGISVTLDHINVMELDVDRVSLDPDEIVLLDNLLQAVGIDGRRAEQDVREPHRRHPDLFQGQAGIVRIRQRVERHIRPCIRKLEQLRLVWDSPDEALVRECALQHIII